MTNVYVFKVSYYTGQIEFQVHPDYGSVEAARAEVDIFANGFGRLPRVLMSLTREVEISDIDANFQANPARGVFHIYSVSAKNAIRKGFYEEVLVHEGVHVSLDMAHKFTEGWRNAQESDGTFVSTYAMENPIREDLAETFNTWFAVRYRPDRLSSSDLDVILATIPNRLAYLDEQQFEMTPYELPSSEVASN